MGDSSLLIDLEVHDQVAFIEANSLMFIRRPYKELKGESSKPVLSIEKPLVLKLKLLPSHLKHPYLGKESTLLMIIFSIFTLKEEEKLSREHKTTLGWLITNIKGIRPLIYYTRF